MNFPFLAFKVWWSARANIWQDISAIAALEKYVMAVTTFGTTRQVALPQIFATVSSCSTLFLMVLLSTDLDISYFHIATWIWIKGSVEVPLV